MKDFEQKLRNIFFKISLYENFLSAFLGGVVILMLGIIVFNYYNKNKFKNIITSEAASTVNEDELRKKEFPKKYIIKEGDSLSKIVSDIDGGNEALDEVIKVNNIIYPDFLNVGDEIKLPYFEGINLASLKSDGEAMIAETIEAIKDDKYVVKEGDTLEIISKKAYGSGGRWIEIANANNLWNPDSIEVGQELVIPR